MSHEIINQVELKEIVASAKTDQDHGFLLAAIQGRYPEHNIQLIATRSDWYRKGGVVDAQGKKVAESYKTWVDELSASSGLSIRQLWDKYKNENFVTTKWQGETLYFVIAYGPGPADFIQIEIDQIKEMTAYYLFDRDIIVPPKQFSDLEYGTQVENMYEITPPKYGFRKMTNIAVFVRNAVYLEHQKRELQRDELNKKEVRIQEIIEHQNGRMESEPPKSVPFLELNPDWFTRKMRIERIFEDWTQSSTRGEKFCEHWFVELKDYGKGIAEREMYFIPQWADKDGGIGLPEIGDGHSDYVYQLKERLDKFDERTGYAFSWYFYMLHGNRIRSEVGHKVFEGYKVGKIGLPECDASVLQRWTENPYGF